MTDREQGHITPGSLHTSSSNKTRVDEAFQALWQRVTSPGYIVSVSGDADPELKQLSTVALEVLRNHATFHMRCFLNIYDLAAMETELRKYSHIRRKSERNSRLAHSMRSLIFTAGDFEPPTSLLHIQEQ